MFPDFICIGAQKAGTTWLHHQLSRHPRLWLPPVKELHYFDRPSRAPLILSLLRSYPGRTRWSRILGARLRDAALGRRLGELPWHARLYLLPRDDGWYRSLFRPAGDRLSGEITPAYARLKEEQVNRIAALLPHLKVIYILRDPIERDWSHARMHFARNGPGLAAASEESMIEFLSSDLCNGHAEYTSNLGRWEQAFGPDRVAVELFDRLVGDPAELLRRLCGFLGIEPVPLMRDEAAGADRNASPPGPPIPRAILRHLAQRHVDETCRLEKRYPGEITRSWRERAESALE